MVQQSIVAHSVNYFVGRETRNGVSLRTRLHTCVGTYGYPGSQPVCRVNLESGSRVIDGFWNSPWMVGTWKAVDSVKWTVLFVVTLLR